MDKETLKRYSKKSSLSDFDKFNLSLPEQLKLTTLGDGKYQLIEKIIENTINQVLSIQETKRPILYRNNDVLYAPCMVAYGMQWNMHYTNCCV